MSSEKKQFDDPFYQKYNKNTSRNGRCLIGDKVCYDTKTQAKNHRKDLELRYHKYFRVYECESCGKWHLATTDSKWSKNK